MKACILYNLEHYLHVIKDDTDQLYGHRENKQELDNIFYIKYVSFGLKLM